MKHSIAWGLIAALAGTLGAAAADVSSLSRSPLISPRSAYELPFPRSERAQSVWASGACWSECGAYCAWGIAACLQRDEQGRCLFLGDTCDRYCLKQCRTSGGPLLNIPD